MLSAHLLVAVVFGGAAIPVSAPSKPTYVIAWAAERKTNEARRSMVEQVDRELRAELGRRGTVVSGSQACDGAIVVVPQLDILPDALKLSLIQIRYTGRSMVGAVTAKISGDARARQLPALIKCAVDEAEQL